MQLEEIITLSEQEYGSKFLFDEDVLVSYANQIQKMAFAKDLESFKVYAYLRVYHSCTLLSSGYTNAVDADIDRNVVGANSGAVGVLKEFSNTTRVWKIYVTSGTFEDGEALTIQAGTGAGTLDESEVYKGPYTATDLEIPCRKLIGVTSVTDSQIFGIDSATDEEGDYGFEQLKDLERDFWEIGRLNPVSKSFTFVDDPELTEDYYRFVYYRSAPTIESIDDDENVLIPEEYHYSVLYNGIIALANNAQYMETPTTPNQILYPFLSEFWKEMEDHHDDVGSDHHRRLGW